MAVPVHCLICNTNVKSEGCSYKNIYDVNHQGAPAPSDHQVALKTRLENLLQVALTDALCHSPLVCNQCESKLTRFEEYYRLVGDFQQVFYQTARWHGVTDDVLDLSRVQSKVSWQSRNIGQNQRRTEQNHLPWQQHVNRKFLELAINEEVSWWNFQQASITKSSTGQTGIKQPGVVVEADNARAELSTGDTPHRKKAVSLSRENGEGAVMGSHTSRENTDNSQDTNLSTGLAEESTRCRSVLSEKTEDGQMDAEAPHDKGQENETLLDKTGDGDQDKEDDKDVRLSSAGGTSSGGKNDKAMLDVPKTAVKELSEQKKTLRSRRSHVVTHTKLEQPRKSRAIKRKGLRGRHPEYECAVCQRSFLTVSSLKQHLKNHTKDAASDKPYQCQKCDLSFETSAGLQVHLSMHQDKKDFRCDICNKDFVRAATLAVHQKCKHGSEKKTCKVVKEECTICNKTFSCKAYLNMHQKTEHLNNRKQHNCSLCQRKFVSEQRRTAHEKRCSKELKTLNLSLDIDADKPYMCLVCNANYKTKGAFKQHYYTHLEEKPFKCVFCEATFLHKKSLNDHVGTKHTGAKPLKAFKCDQCSQAYSHPGDLSKHMTLHTRKYICSTCDRAFAGSYKLKEHMRVHTGDKPYKCEFCGAQFAQAAALKSHMYNHEGVKRFLCTTCGMQFAHRTTLKRHMMSHTGLRPYECQECKKTFQFEWVLKDHVKIHTGEKPYLCSVCGKSFTQPQHLKTHFRIHTGEKPYNCFLCSATYRHLSSFNQHKKSCHGDIYFPKGNQGKIPAVAMATVDANHISVPPHDMQTGSSIYAGGVVSSAGLINGELPVSCSSVEVGSLALEATPGIVPNNQLSNVLSDAASANHVQSLSNRRPISGMQFAAVPSTQPLDVRSLGHSQAEENPGSPPNVGYPLTTPNMLNQTSAPNVIAPGSEPNRNLLNARPSTTNPSSTVDLAHLGPAFHLPNPPSMPSMLSHGTLLIPQDMGQGTSASLLPLGYGQDCVRPPQKF